ncbi:nucleotidyl transferase AbiEii/AbiGii toxin family protein [Acidisphaera sp. S103]|uniref:nucleotidyl transferase AbiEii/AbiGii toxin family protein n=1 Tax=Acidisphaera sp. S103 TaxID=1747223 RepID=UPI00131AF13C|nr:nucleotidyl transferase AbiEii/AbiGii toxin family protein [Acidisphaera sp. S103]
MSDELPGNLRPIVDFFGLPGSAVVAKDFFVVRAIRILAAIDAAPFDLVFGGGTALARAHRIVRRMSEDVDFKIVPRTAEPVSRSALRRQLDRVRKDISAALLDGGFAFDLADKSVAWARDEGRYAVWHLPYPSGGGAGEGLRPAIKVEVNYALLRRPALMLQVSSFVAEATNRQPEVAQLACVSLAQTAAEKLVSLTRRTAMEMAGASRDPDPTLVRHIYDLHMMRALVEPADIAALARVIAETDAEEFASQYPAYAADIAGETRKAVEALRTDPMHRRRYDDFVSAMVYGEKPDFGTAFGTVMNLADKMIQQGWNGK